VSEPLTTLFRPVGQGYVLRFRVETVYLARYPERIAGGARHRELWVPAEDLDEFNRHIRGPIEVIAEFRDVRAS